MTSKPNAKDKPGFKYAAGTFDSAPSQSTKTQPVNPNWRCVECDCPPTRTPMIRPGPAGKKSLCNACYIRHKVQKEKELRGSARPKVGGGIPGDDSANHSTSSFTSYTATPFASPYSKPREISDSNQSSSNVSVQSALESISTSHENEQLKSITMNNHQLYSMYAQIPEIEQLLAPGNERFFNSDSLSEFTEKKTRKPSITKSQYRRNRSESNFMMEFIVDDDDAELDALLERKGAPQKRESEEETSHHFDSVSSKKAKTLVPGSSQQATPARDTSES